MTTSTAIYDHLKTGQRGHEVPFKNLAFLLLTKAWQIGPNRRRVWPKIALRRRLGMNTTWYLQVPLGVDRLW